MNAWIGCLLATGVLGSVSAALAGDGPADVSSFHRDLPLVERDWPAAGAAAADDWEPVTLLKDALDRCTRQVAAYTCTFAKQERMRGTLHPEQLMHVVYRESPRSVDMTWVRNAGRARRLIWVRGTHLDGNGQEQALVEPAGAILRALVGNVEIPIHGADARKSSRRSVDEFGFQATLTRLVNDNDRLAKAGTVDWRFEGEGEVDGRPTLILVRRLPYTGPQGIFPDARLVVHLDREWRLPVAVYSYADADGRVLLGSYVTTDVQLDPAPAALAFRL